MVDFIAIGAALILFVLIFLANRPDEEGQEGT